MFNLNDQNIPVGEEIPCEKLCPASAFQLANVFVPITVLPFAEAGIPRTTCCGEAVVIPGKDACHCRPNGSCSFTISQRILIEIPVNFGAKAVIGHTTVDCECATNHDICRRYDDANEEQEV